MSEAQAEQNYRDVRERPSSWYHDGRMAAEAAVIADCKQDLHTGEVLSSHKGRPTVAEQRQRQGMA